MKKVLTSMIVGDRSTVMRVTKPQNEYVPQFEIESIARMLLPKMQAYFESEQGKREFKEWKNSLQEG